MSSRYFSTPFEMAVFRRLRVSSRAERELALEKAFYNTVLLPQELIYIDLKTDGGVSAVSTTQLAAQIETTGLESQVEMARESNVAMTRLEENVLRYFGFRFVTACSLGRATERLWSQIYLSSETTVFGNMLFGSLRYHIKNQGSSFVDVIGDSAYDPFSTEPFKGNVDLSKLESSVRRLGGIKPFHAFIELGVNACGGHPISMENLRSVSALVKTGGGHLFVDATRILENSRLIQLREPGFEKKSIAEIVLETCALADGCTLSALKDFGVRHVGLLALRDDKNFLKSQHESWINGMQPKSAEIASLNESFDFLLQHDNVVASRVEEVHYLWELLSKAGIPVLRPQGGHAVFIDLKSFFSGHSQENFRAEALAAFVYLNSGIRLTKGIGYTEGQQSRKVDLIRLALPARRYLKSHLEDVADAVIHAYESRSQIGGLRSIESPERGPFQPTKLRLLEG